MGVMLKTVKNMKTLGLILLLAANFGFAQTNAITFTNRHGKVYRDVIITEVNRDWLTWSPVRGMGVGRVRMSDLSDDMQRQYGYDSVQGTERDLEAALASGLFRELNGIVYDLRKPQPDWVQFYGTWLAGQNQEGAFIVPKPADLAISGRRLDGIVDDKTFKPIPYASSGSNPGDLLIFVKHLKPAGEYLSFWARRTGMFTLSKPMLIGKRIFSGGISRR